MGVSWLILMKKDNPLFNAVYKNIEGADALISAEGTSQYNAVKAKRNTLNSLWFRVIDESVDDRTGRLEELSMELEKAITRCSDWLIKNNKFANTHNPDDTESNAQ